MSWLERSGIKKPEGGDSGLHDDENIPHVKNDRASPVIDEERGIPSVNQRSFKSRAMPISLAALAIAIAGVIWLIPGPKAPDVKVAGDPKATKNERFDENLHAAILAPAKPPEPPAPPPVAAKEAPPINVIPAPDGKVGPQASGPSNQKVLTPFEQRQLSKQIIVSGGLGSAAVAASPGSANQAKSGVAPGIPEGQMPIIPAIPAMPDSSGVSGKSDGKNDAVNGGGGSLAEVLTATKLVAVSATRLQDRTFTIARGAMLDCSLDTAISSAVPGMTKCTTTRPIYGDDGKVVMLDRGTELTGQYQGALQQGQSRLFILWTRAKTPNGVIIDLASPGTDSLGRSGVDGYIDTHFWARFGSALLLSVVDDVASILGRAKQGSGNNTIVLPSTQNTSKTAASIAVENSIKIPPTLNKNQGEHVSVFVARDLDFRTVYSLQLPSGPVHAANDDHYVVKASN